MSEKTIRGIAGRTIPLIISLPLLAGFFVFDAFAEKSLSSIVINEIHITGGTGKTSEDFIELYNPNDVAVSLGDWQLKKKTSTGTESSINKFDAIAIIPAHGYFLWANSANGYADLLEADTSTGATIASNNSLALLDTEGEIIDAVGWGSCGINAYKESHCFPENPDEYQSLARVNDGDDNSLDFSLKAPNPDSGRCAKHPENPNCILPAPPKILPKIYPTGIRINEILPHPIVDEKINEYIELYNSSDTAINLSGWTLRDDSKTGKYIFPDKSEIESKKFLTIYRADFDFALNNSGNETVTLFNPNNEIISEISYESANEGISYNYFDSTLWRWSKFLTPGTENQFEDLPRIQYFFPKNAYPDIYAKFSVKVRAVKKEKLKITWNFGDGHKSYIASTRHRYEQLGKYSASVTVFNGSEETKKEFLVAVKKFSRPKVRIIALTPNPPGKDSAKEWVEIRNGSKKKINLVGWSLATGTKKLVNHWIKEDFVIPAKKSRMLTREYASFTLPNTKGKIELRYPDGKKADKVKYEKKKIEEGEVYSRNENKQWTWKNSKPVIENNPQISNNNSDFSDENISPTIEEPEISFEDIGKFSQEPTLANKSQTILLATMPVTLPLDKWSQPIVLGAATEKVILRLWENNYAFTAPSFLLEHYAVKFFRNVTAKFNLFLTALQ